MENYEFHEYTKIREIEFSMKIPFKIAVLLSEMEGLTFTIHTRDYRDIVGREFEGKGCTVWQYWEVKGLTSVKGLNPTNKVIVISNTKESSEYLLRGEGHSIIRNSTQYYNDIEDKYNALMELVNEMHDELHEIREEWFPMMQYVKVPSELSDVYPQ